MPSMQNEKGMKFSMDLIYPFITAFLLIFLSELGDKTQLLVASFYGKSKASNILIGVAIGTLFSHGLAILFGSKLGSLENDYLHHILQLVTYFTFLFFGIFGLIPKKNKQSSTSSENGIIYKISNLSFNYIFIVAFTIIVGELGDKTFLASMGLGLQYPDSKFPLILGAILGMVISDSIALFFAKLIGKKIPQNLIEICSNILFILFGSISLIMFFI